MPVNPAHRPPVTNVAFGKSDNKTNAPNNAQQPAESTGDQLNLSVSRGFKRTAAKFFLRPRGWAELTAGLVTLPFFPVILPFFAAKHFLEGLVNANSLVKGRWRLGRIHPLHHDNKDFKTVVDAAKAGFKTPQNT